MKAVTLTPEEFTTRITAGALPAPVLTHVFPEKRWRLEKTYIYRDGDSIIKIPEGFKFDLASIPRPFWWFLAPFELSITAPLVHDFLYRSAGNPPPGAIAPFRTYSKKQSDLLFRKIMKTEGVPGWRRVLAYRAVRLLGCRAWKAGCARTAARIAQAQTAANGRSGSETAMAAKARRPRRLRRRLEFDYFGWSGRRLQRSGLSLPK